MLLVHNSKRLAIHNVSFSQHQKKKMKMKMVIATSGLPDSSMVFNHFVSREIVVPLLEKTARLPLIYARNSSF